MKSTSAYTSSFFSLALLASPSVQASTTVTGHFSPTDPAFWTGGGAAGTNGTIGGNVDGTLDVTDGSVLNLKRAFFGSGTAGGTATITLGGDGSQILIADYLYLGNNTGTGNMGISGGAYLKTTNSSVVANGASASGTMTIDGAGSLWEALGNVVVGNSGNGTLTVQNEAKFQGTVLQVGSGTLNVSGGGETVPSTVTLSGSFSIDAGGSALVSNGGHLHAGTEITVNGSLEAEGNGSEVESGEEQLFTITSGDGSAAITLRDGASASSTYLNIGYGTGQAGTLTLTGAGSEWQSDDDVKVGAESGTGQLHVRDGARFSSGDYLYVNAGSTMNVWDAGSSSTANIISIYGTLLLQDGGRLDVAQLSNHSGTTVRTGAEIKVNGKFGQGAGGSMIVDGGTLILPRFEDTEGVIAISDPAGGTALTVGSDASLDFPWEYRCSAVIEDHTSGPGSITKVGSNPMILSAANTFSGTTTISKGTILIENSLALQNSTVVLSVNNGLDLNGLDATLGGLAGSGRLALGDQTLTVGGNGESRTYTGILSGTGGLIKTGAGRLTLSGTNTHSGTTTVDAGQIRLGNASALQNSTLNLIGVDGFDFNGANASVGGLSGSGDLDLGAQFLTVGGNDESTTYSGVMSGTGGLTKVGEGTLILTGNNTFTGDTTISEGILQLGDEGTSGSLSGNIVNNATLVIDRSDNFTLSNSIDGTGDLAKRGSGNLTLGVANAFTGTTTIEQGTIILGVPNALRSSTVELTRSWVLNLNNKNANLGGLSGSGAITVNADRTLTVGYNNESTTYSGPLPGVGNLTKTGSGAWTIDGQLNLSGITTIEGGSIVAGISNLLPNSTVSVQVDGGLDLNGYDVTLGALHGAGNIDLGSQALSVGRNGANTTYTGVLSGSGGLTKTGTGTLTLSGANTHGGDTVISEGAVKLANEFALQNSTVVAEADNPFVLDALANRFGGLAGNGDIDGEFYEFRIGANNEDTTYSGNFIRGSYLTKEGTGTWTLTGDALDLCPIDLSGGAVIFDGAGGSVKQIFAGDSDLDVTFRNGADMTVPSGLHDLSLTVSGSLTDIVVEDAVDGLADLRVDDGAFLRVTGAFAVPGNSAIVNQGALLLSDVSEANSQGKSLQISDSDGGPALTIRTDADMTFAADISDYSSGPGGVAKLGSGALTLSGQNDFTGTVSVMNGTLITAQLSGNLLQNAGRFRTGPAPAAATIGGDYDLGSPATLEIRIGGTQPGTEHDVITIGGTAKLDGTVEVLLVDDFEPAPGDSFTILNAAAITDQGYSFSFPAVTGHREWTVEADATSLTLTYDYANTLDGFREKYGLNPDGSDDSLDWSDNGVANLLYLAFGLGDPNEADIDRSRLPAVSGVSDHGDYVFSFVQPNADVGLMLTVETSDDLSTWPDLDDMETAYQPVHTETESLDANYERQTLHFDSVPGEEHRFYRMGVEVSDEEAAAQ